MKYKLHMIAAALLLGTAACWGQVFQLDGGTSSLFQATGGSMNVEGAGYSGWVGAGSLAGQWTAGAALKTRWRNSTLSVGDEMIPFHLPTDIFNGSHYFLGSGAGIKSHWKNLDLFGFGGTTATELDAPYFRGARAERGAGALFLDDRVSPKLRLFSRNVFSRQLTSISGVEWHPLPGVRAAFSGGMGANHRYLGSSLTTGWEWISLKAAYLLADRRFRRVLVQTPVISENDRENILLRVRPKPYLSFTAGRFNFLQPLQNSEQGLRAVVNQFSASATAARFSLTGSLFESRTRGTHTQGTAFTVGRHFGRIFQATASLYRSWSAGSPGTTSLVTMLRENLSPRLSVLEVVNQSNGRPTVSFGGNFISNLISVGVNYQTVYVPFRTASPFRQALVLNVRFHPFGSLQVRTGSYVAPDGSVKYTVSSSTFLYHGEPGKGPVPRFKFPGYIVRGAVVNEKGEPIEGAALRIGRDSVFTNSEGKFFLRRKTSRPRPLQVRLNDFLVPGKYEVVSCPRTVTPVKDGQEKESVIVVRRVRIHLVAASGAS